MVDELPEAPDPATDTPQVFSQKAAAMVLAQRALPGQINATVAEIAGMIGGIGAIAAGGAYAIPYIFDSTTTDADPGAGKLRLSSATQNAATVMRLDLTPAGQDYTGLIDTFDDSTSPVKGAIRLVKQGDITKWMTFNLTGMATPTGYRNLSVVCTDSSAASPFANGDALMLSFQRTGDKGVDAANAMQFLGSATVSAAVAQIDFLNIFTSAYDRYVVEVSGACVSQDGAALLLRVARGGTIDTTTSYYEGYANTGFNALSLGGNLFSLSFASLTLDFRDTNSTASLGVKSIGIRGAMRDASQYNQVRMAECGFRGSTLSGFRLYVASGNISAGTVRVYGIRNS